MINLRRTEMMTKDIYEELDMSVITFENVDIITDSKDTDGLPPYDAT